MPEKRTRVLQRRTARGSFSTDERDQIVLIDRPVRHPRRLKRKRPESIAETLRSVRQELAR